MTEKPNSGAVFGAILAERWRQIELRRAGKFKYTCADHEASDVQRTAILTEEFLEVMKALQGDGMLEEELTQLAAVAVSWLERIYAERGESEL